MKINAKINQSILMMAVLSLFIAIFWLLTGISSALKKTEKPIVGPKEIAPLQPSLDKTVLDDLQQRK